MPTLLLAVLVLTAAAAHGQIQCRGPHGQVLEMTPDEYSAWGHRVCGPLDPDARRRARDQRLVLESGGDPKRFAELWEAETKRDYQRYQNWKTCVEDWFAHTPRAKRTAQNSPYERCARQVGMR